MLQYGGVDLLTPDASGWLNDYLQRTDLARLDLFGASPVALCDQRTNAVGNHQPVTPFPLPNYHAPPPLGINQLYWPSGATRWSTFVGLVDSDGLDAIRAKLTTETSLGEPAHLMTPLPFVMADSDFQGPITPSVPIDTDGRMSVQTNLYMLEPRAISTVQGRDTLWLLPLVDVRYFWQYRQMPHRVPASLLTGRVTETSLKTSWHGWLSLVQHALDPRPAATRDVTLEFLPDDIPDEYFFPDRTEFDHSQHNAAVVLDALAHSCGRRFVRQYNGDCELIDVTESHKRHAAQLVDNSGGGIAILAQAAAEDIDATTAGQNVYAKMAIYPQFVDVGFRQLVEYDLDDVPDDEPAGTLPAPFNVTTAVLAGPGTRTVRNDTRISGARSIVEHTSKIIHTPSWVGRHLWHDGTGTCPEPPGLIDDVFYGDRYFRLAKQITDDYVDWMSQQHEYDYPGFQPRTLSGFDDYIIWDHQRGSTHLKSHSNDFGVATQLVQVHRQCTFDPDQTVALLVSDWSLYPSGLADGCCTGCGEVSVDGENHFAFTWQWAEAQARPLIPTDPWAHASSLEYGRTRAFASGEITVVSRLQTLIQSLAGTGSTVAASGGIAYVRRNGCEWEVIEYDENAEPPDDCACSDSASDSLSDSFGDPSGSASGDPSASASGGSGDPSTSTSGGAGSGSGSGAGSGSGSLIECTGCSGPTVPTQLTVTIDCFELDFNNIPPTPPASRQCVTEATLVHNGTAWVVELADDVSFGNIDSTDCSSLDGDYRLTANFNCDRLQFCRVNKNNPADFACTAITIRDITNCSPFQWGSYDMYMDVGGSTLGFHVTVNE